MQRNNVGDFITQIKSCLNLFDKVVHPENENEKSNHGGCVKTFTLLKQIPNHFNNQPKHNYRVMVLAVEKNIKLNKNLIIKVTNNGWIVLFRSFHTYSVWP